MQKLIEISVCVITYNQENTISRTLECLVNQDFSLSYEIIIGEDCSTDNTLEICLDYQMRYPELIKVLSGVNNIGLLANVSRVTKEIRGKYFGLCAGDDFWHDPNKLRMQYDYMQQHKKCCLVYSSYYTLNSKTQETNLFRLKNIKQGKVFESLFLGNFIPALTTLIRMESFLNYVSLDEYSKLGFKMEDYPMWLDLSFYGEVGYIDVPLATYQLSGDSISNPQNISSNISFAKNVILVKRYYSKKYKLNRNVLIESIYISNLQILGLVKRYNKFSEFLVIISNIDWMFILKYNLKFLISRNKSL